MIALPQAIEEAALWLAEREGITLKTIGQIVRRYGDQLSNAVHDVWNGHSDAIDFRRFHKALLKESAPAAYLEGLREGGIDELDDEDQADMDEAVSDWLGGQLEHVNQFGKDVAEAHSNKDARPAILSRVEMWVDSLRTLGDMARAYALQNERGQWTLGATEEHCETCLKLSNMKPHRLSWYTSRGYIPRQNGSDTLQCGGWKCDCSIVDKKGAQLL